MTTRGSYRSQTFEREKERERVKVRHYNTHRGLPKGLAINCASHQMPTGKLMTTVIILKVRWIGEPWEWTRYSLLVFVGCCVTRRDDDKERKKERKKRRRRRKGRIGNETNTIRLFVSSDNEVDSLSCCRLLNVTEPRTLGGRSFILITDHQGIMETPLPRPGIWLG